MKRIRVIPVLTVMGNKLVKTVRFSKPNYLGDPLNAIKIFNDKRVDELVVLDITASKDKREPNFKLIEEMAGEAFMPLGYGGGIHSFAQASKVFALGVEKVVLNSAVYSNPDLISEIAAVYGNQSVVVCMDVKKSFLGKYKACFFSGTKTMSTEVNDIIMTCIQKGVGEIVLQSLDREGTFEGFDTNMISRFSDVEVPVVALGGCNSLENMTKAIGAGANAIAAGSFFAYRNNDTRSILIHYPEINELNSLRI